MSVTNRKLAGLAILASAYFITGKLGLTLAYLHPSATAVWPPTGIALAALLLFGCELWPAILLGAFLVNITTAGSSLVCLGIAAGNTLEALAGAWLVNRYAHGSNAVYRTPDIFKFALLGGFLSSSIAATFGVTSLVLGGDATWAAYRSLWFTWWLGDAAGALLVAPLLILWIMRPQLRWRQNQYLEAASILISLLVTGLVVFDGVFDLAVKNYPLEYLCVPFLLWVAYRFSAREAATATVFLSGTAISGALHGYGPFGRESHNASLLLLQTFLGVVGVTTLALAAAFEERRIAEEQSHFLAVSDPLTRLGNYRKLVDTMEMEIRRSSRTGKAFALLLLDMDDLKRINDTHGHLVGSRSLIRLAEALRASSRNIDTAARFGGDEFALILPELGPDHSHEVWEDLGPDLGRRPRGAQEPLHAGGYSVPSRVEHRRGSGDLVQDVAREVARRIRAHLGNDDEFPKLSVSIGAAHFPADGDNIEQLLNAADKALYRDKRSKKVQGHVQPSTVVVTTLPAAGPSTPAVTAPLTLADARKPSMPIRLIGWHRFR